MNDFLAKPIEVEELWSVLRRWVKPRVVTPASPPRQGSLRAASASPGLPRDIEGLDVRAGLGRVLGNEETYRTLLKRFTAGQAGVVDEIRFALAANDPARAERLAHTLKGLAGTVGAATVQGLAKEVESSLRERAVPSVIHEKLGPLGSALQRLVEEIDAKLSVARPPTPEVAIVDRAQLAEVCRALDRLLAESDMDAAKLIAANASLLRAAFGADFGRLEVPVLSIEFEEARRVLAVLVAERGVSSDAS